MTGFDNKVGADAVAEQCGVIWDAVSALQNLARVMHSDDPILRGEIAEVPIAPLWRDLPVSGRNLFQALLPGWLAPASGALIFVQNIHRADS